MTTKVVLELTVKETSVRIRGYGEEAIMEHSLTHPLMQGSLKFQCKRKDLADVLKEFAEGLDSRKKDFEGDVSLVDVGNELARSSTGIPLSEKEQNELKTLLDGKSAVEQRDGAFRIKIS